MSCTDRGRSDRRRTRAVREHPANHRQVGASEEHFAVHEIGRGVEYSSQREAFLQRLETRRVEVRIHNTRRGQQSGNDIGILDVELHGRMSRAAWQELDPPSLMQRAASAGTLLRFAIDQLVVNDSPIAADALARSSFLVNTRRVSERLLAAAGDDNPRELIAAARARVVEIARRREPTKAMS